MNRITIEQMEEEARESAARTTAIGGGDGALEHPAARTTIRGGAPHMPRMTAGGGGTATDDAYGMHTAGTMHDQNTTQPQPPTQRHKDGGTTTIDTGLQQRVHFEDSQPDDDHGQPPGGETAAALHDSAKAAYGFQQQQAGTHEHPQTYTQHQPLDAAAAATTAPDQTAQQ